MKGFKSNRQTMLHCSVFYGDVKGTNTLLDHADIQVNSKDKEGITPLMEAFATRSNFHLCLSHFYFRWNISSML